MAVSMKGRSLVSIADFTVEEIWNVWDLAAEMKRKQKTGEPHRHSRRQAPGDDLPEAFATHPGQL